MRTRGAVGGAGLRTRGPVRTRGGAASRSAPGARGPAEIAREIAGDPELLTAYRHLKKAAADPALRETVLNALEAFARMVESRAPGKPDSPKKHV